MVIEYLNEKAVLNYFFVLTIDSITIIIIIWKILSNTCKANIEAIYILALYC